MSQCFCLGGVFADQRGGGIAAALAAVLCVVVKGKNSPGVSINGVIKFLSVLGVELYVIDSAPIVPFQFTLKEGDLGGLQSGVSQCFCLGGIVTDQVGGGSAILAKGHGSACAVPVNLFVHQLPDVAYRQIEGVIVEQGIDGGTAGGGEGTLDPVHPDADLWAQLCRDRVGSGTGIRGTGGRRAV